MIKLKADGSNFMLWRRGIVQRRESETTRRIRDGDGEAGDDDRKQHRLSDGLTAPP